MPSARHGPVSPPTCLNDGRVEARICNLAKQATTGPSSFLFTSIASCDALYEAFSFSVIQHSKPNPMMQIVECIKRGPNLGLHST
jgi:hypothetical protein